MGGVVLLTGATGLLGAQVARRLISQTDHQVVALVRAPDAQAATRRLARAWWDWPELAAEIAGGRVRAVAGDVREPGLGLDPVAWQRTTRRVTHIVHTAADLRVAAPLAEVRRTNVAGVAHLLELASAAHHDHGLTRLTHVSTAYVAGLTYAARQESLDRVGNLWPLVLLAAPLVLALPALREGAGAIVILLGLIGWSAYAVYLLAKRPMPGAVPRAIGALIAGIALVDAAFLAGIGAIMPAFIAVAGFVATMALQRYIAGT